MAAAGLVYACAGEPQSPYWAPLSQPVVASSAVPAPRVSDSISPGWARILPAGDSLTLRMAYAADSNIAGRQLYDCEVCLLRPRAAAALREACAAAAAEGYGLVLFDCYRPQSAQTALYRSLSDSRYVAAPGKGSAHSRGLAVDAGLIRNGLLVDMGSGFDEMTPRSAFDAAGLTDAQRMARADLRRFFTGAGFKPYEAEWWHFSLSPAGDDLSDYRWPCPDSTQQ